MRVTFKKGVWCTFPMRPELSHAIYVAERAYSKHVDEMVVTSLENDHEHNLESRHHEGLAVDLRIWNLPDGVVGEVLDEIIKYLGEAYWAVLHPVADPNHIHIQYRRKMT